VLDQPADRLQASQRPPGADHVEVDVCAAAGDDVAKVLLVPEGQDGEVVQGIALARLGPVDHAGDLVTRSLWATTTSTSSTSAIITGMTTDCRRVYRVQLRG
jgi:hypothetical protein